MEGVRRANTSPWTAGPSGNAVAAPSCSFLSHSFPLSIASMLIVFGQFVTVWLALHIDPNRPHSVLRRRSSFRWTVALIGSVGIIGLIYHLGTPMQQSWKRVLPGAIVSTIMWFLSHAHLRLVRHPFRQLLSGLRITRRRHRTALLALHHLAQRPLRRRIQHAVPRPLLFTRTHSFRLDAPKSPFHQLEWPTAVKTQWSYHPKRRDGEKVPANDP